MPCLHSTTHSHYCWNMHSLDRSASFTTMYLRTNVLNLEKPLFLQDHSGSESQTLPRMEQYFVCGFNCVLLTNQFLPGGIYAEDIRL